MNKIFVKSSKLLFGCLVMGLSYRLVDTLNARVQPDQNQKITKDYCIKLIANIGIASTGIGLANKIWRGI